ncbi:MAG: phospholipase D-like domain-containing protein [Brevinematia bacterium]
MARTLCFSFIFTFLIDSYIFPQILSFFNTPEFGDKLKDIIIAYINYSQESISISAYSFDDPDIANALLNAGQRGVKIRMVIDSDNWNSLIDILDSHQNIEIFNDLKLKGKKANARQHHSKFIVIDYGSITSPVRNTIITGSFNFTVNSSLMQYNNIIVVENNIDVANMYIQEFNEEWGSSSFQFNPEASRFGKQKTDPPPYLHSSGNIEVYFSYSPENKIKDRIIQLLSSATNIFFCIYSFSTNSEIFGTVYELTDIKDIFGVFDESQTGQFSAFHYLIDKKPENFVVDSEHKILHNKYIILNYDENHPENAIVITGSYNFSRNAEENNEENVIIIKNSPEIAKKFMKDFLYHFTRSGKTIPTLSIPSFLKTNIVCLQNSTNTLLGKNLHKIVSIFISNESVYLPVTIVSNLTNRIVFSVPQVDGNFSVISLLINGETEVTPVNLTILPRSKQFLLVNKGKNFIRIDEPVEIRLYSHEALSTPYVKIQADNKTKFVLLKDEGECYSSTIFLDTFLEKVSNNTPIVFSYSNISLTNYVVLPSFSYIIIKPRKVYRNSYSSIKVEVRSVFDRRIRISADGNIPLVISEDGTVSFFVKNEEKVKIFLSIEDELGNSSSEYIELETYGSDNIVVYPTVVNKGEKIFVDGEFEKVEIFNKTYDIVSFSSGEDEIGRRYIVPTVSKPSELLFLIFHANNKKIIRKVIVR